jgi:transmembrane sensor
MPAETDAALAIAAQWFERLQNEDLASEDVLSWQRWLAADAAHRDAFERCQDLWKRLDEMPAPKLPSRAELAAETRGAQNLRIFALAASFIALAVLVAWVLIGKSAPSSQMTAFETGAAEHQDARLPDGSQLSLGAKSLLVIHFVAQERSVALERGEAFFEVARDKERPFVVRAGGAMITAIGTAFNVRKTGGRVLVAVSEGIVMVEDSQTHLERRVGSGQQVVMERSEAAPKVRAMNPDAAMGWRAGRLQYLGEPLKYVLADVSRYSKEEITLADPQAGELLVTGTVFESDVDAWLGSLEEILPVTVQRQKSGRVVGMRRD